MTDTAAVDRLENLWRMMAPPLRPGPQDVAAVAGMAPSPAGGTVLVLGATPELVDLALERGAARVLAMDTNEPVFDAMRRLSRQDWSRVVPVVEDWHVLREELCGQVRVVMGDGSFCLVDYPGGWKSVLAAVRRYLEPSGVGVFRTMFQPSPPLDWKVCRRAALADFEERMGSAPSGRRVEAFRGVASTIRLVSIIGALRPDGQVDLDRRRQIYDEVMEYLSRTYRGRDVWPVIETVFGTKQEMKGGRIITRALAKWEDAQRVIEACGFSVLGMRQAGESPGRDIYRTYAIRPEGS